MVGIVLSILGLRWALNLLMDALWYHRLTGAKALINAIARGDLNRVKKLLSAGVNVSGADAFGDTPLRVAVLKGHDEIAELLVNAGASGADRLAFEQQKRQQQLSEAAVAGRVEDMNALIAVGVNINGLDEQGRTALHAALIARQVAAVVYLLDRGADPNICTESGVSPLALAIDAESLDASTDSRGRPAAADMTLALLLKGADANAPSGGGLTPLALALARGHGRAADLIRDWSR